MGFFLRVGKARLNVMKINPKKTRGHFLSVEMIFNIGTILYC